jgi:hypothetical protein
MRTHVWLTLVDIGLGVVDVLVLLVTEGVNGSVGASAEAGVRVLGDLLVGGLGGLGTSTLDGLRDVVGGVLFAGMLACCV